MKTITHKLFSKAGIEFPEETEEHVKEFFSMIKANENDINLINKMWKSDYFSEMPSYLQANLVEKASKLKETKSERSKSKYVKEIYLFIGTHDFNIAIDKGLDNLEKNVNETFKEIYKNRLN